MTTTRPIDLVTLVAELRAGKVDHFWNVLTEEFFAGELIAGSRWVPLDRGGRVASATGIAKDARIIVYCSGLSCPNSKDAGAKLATLGFTNVGVFAGGLEAWKADGRGRGVGCATQ